MQWRRQAAAAFALLPPDQYPYLTATAQEASMAMDGEEQFEYGLLRLLDGIETAAGTVRSTEPTPKTSCVNLRAG